MLNSFSHRLAWITAGAAFLLLLAGGMVTSTRSGMATADPILMDGGFAGTKLYEHGHRILGWCTGFLALLTVLFVGLSEKRGSVRKLAVGILAAIVAQGLLGMLTVKLQLSRPEVSVAHAGLAQITFSLLVALVVVTLPGWSSAAPSARARNAALAIFAQILLGAWYRHTGSPPAMVAHFAGILLVAVCIFRLTEARRLHLLFFAQMMLGPLTLALRKPKEIFVAQPEPLSTALPVTAHVAVGALMMAAAVWTLLRPAASASPDPVPENPDPASGLRHPSAL